MVCLVGFTFPETRVAVAYVFFFFGTSQGMCFFFLGQNSTSSEMCVRYKTCEKSMIQKNVRTAFAANSDVQVQ